MASCAMAGTLLIVDVDGTLLFTRQLSHDAYQDACAALRRDFNESAWDESFGKCWADFRKTMWPELTSFECLEIRKAKGTLYRAEQECWNEPIVNLVKSWPDATIAIASASGRPSLDRKLLERFPDLHLLYTEERKSDSEWLQDLLSRIQYDHYTDTMNELPKDIVVIDDDQRVIAQAKALGLKWIQVNLE